VVARGILSGDYFRDSTRTDQPMDIDRDVCLTFAAGVCYRPEMFQCSKRYENENEIYRLLFVLRESVICQKKNENWIKWKLRQAERSKTTFLRCNSIQQPVKMQFAE